MSIINIRGTTAVDDPEYRYKMPAIMGKVEGRGNGIKTALPNMTQLAASLHREPGEVTKFFGTELGAQTTWTAETERAIVNGAHTTQDLQTNLFKYVEKFVLCPSCRLPETIYKVKSEMIYSTCAACGAKEPLDMTHKLTVYILAQDKKRKKEKKDAEKKDEKDAKKKGDKKKKAEEDDEDDEEAPAKEKKVKKEKKDKKDKKDKKEKKDKKDKKDKKSKKDKASDSDSDDDAASDASDGGGAAAEDNSASDDDGAAAGGGGGGAGNADAAEALSDMTLGATAKELCVKDLVAYLAPGGPGNGAEPAAVVAKLREMQTSSGLMLKECPYIFCGAAFDEQVLKAGQVKTWAPVLAALVATDANKFMARHLIGALEEMFGGHLASLQKAFPVVLKQLYDEDVLEEDVLLDWASQGVTYEFSPQGLTTEQVKEGMAAAEPFVTWLKEADEDSD